MKTQIICLFSILLSAAGYAQPSQSDLSIGISFKNVPFYTDHLPALVLESHYYVTDRWSTGGNLIYSRQKYGHSFGLDARRTFLYYFSANWSNRFGVLQTAKVNIDANLDLGVGVATLRDRENYEWVDSGYYYDDWYYSSRSKVYDKLGRDTYFTAFPNVSMSYKLFELSKEENLGIHLVANAGYQFAFGNGDFTNTKDLQGFAWLFGIKIMGATKTAL